MSSSGASSTIGGDWVSETPARGTLTTEEAEAFCDAQIVEMQVIQEDTERINAEIAQAKKELAAAMKEVDRLSYERSREEAFAKEALASLSKRGKRDLRTEPSDR
ncbi:hypothetical protein OC846_001628 [Tilletia horrida]|uniref:Uncharacterized protein n=1 Tax=Tilletia horrida TaxID=155126 RepID=A0AAN6JZP8_9BASI|nr:hypothetical protein OC845_003033 [Tilletia horrida]KAK0555663.1 hypothetical protein OC846_001628 [Tilletia horrida]KAK0568564.1 hypothetical protein OC861_001812 [Tilletia horrida]